MRNIGGTNYISAKEYAAMKNISEARVSQMKSELPFEKLEDIGVSLINFDLLKLSDLEISFAQTQFQTTQSIHTYSYKDLGLFLADMIKTANDTRANSELIIREKDEQLAKALQKKQELERELATFKAQEQRLSTSLEQTQEQLKIVQQSHQELKVNLEVVTAQKVEVDTELANLKVVQQKTQADYELKIVENQGLDKENTYLKAQIESWKKELEAEKIFKQRFEKLEELVMRNVAPKTLTKKPKK